MISAHLTDWLLAAPTPSIRYLTLRHLLDRPETDAEVQAARREIMSVGPVPVILAKQTDTGQWADEHSYYTPKYVSTHWSLLLLAELHSEADDPCFRRGVEFMLDKTLAALTRATGENKTDLACFWSNLLRYAVYTGYADDPRTQAVTRYLLRSLQQDDVCRCAYNWHYACAWGAARTLWALAALPQACRPPETEAAIQHAVAFLLESFSLTEANYPTDPERGKIHPLWHRLNSPLFYQADILFVLRTLAELDQLDHPSAQIALDWLAARQRRGGRWHGSSPYRGRTWKALGDQEETDRWVSLHAALILRQAGRVV
ncbi:MAG: hypothetical protein HZC41_11960 [Chloroflexi bacterium]|nr:hypothetical protein [Chloroflexota bacterium]